MDPGFPIGGHQPLLEGAPASDTGAFQWKHVKMKEFGPVGRGACLKLLYVDPPLLLYINIWPIDLFGGNIYMFTKSYYT